MNDMAAIAALPPLREVIARFGLSAKRSLGQNFLLDLNLTRRIARAAAPLEQAIILEIGPGPGALTRALLLEGAAHVVAVERDQRCLAALTELQSAAPGRLQIVAADALAVNQKQLAEDAAESNQPIKIVANLPYNISTALLVQWLESEPWPPWFASLTLLFQKEVAERFKAAPKSKTYGRLSVLVQWRCTVETLFDISPRAFTPAPTVISTLVQIIPRAQPLFPAERHALSTISAAAFGQRRKMLRSSLATLKLDSAHLLQVADVDPTARAEELNVEQFCALARAFIELGGSQSPGMRSPLKPERT
jgi:16S rRNA (adenine1518-N6/adenine1519-N6)-dimethyltransferase